MRCLVVAAYVLPAAAAWTVLGVGVAVLPLTAAGLVCTTGYGLAYGVSELTGWRGLGVPGRRWQVPQTMMIDARPARRVLVWGALLGPGFLTRNPYAGFCLLPLAVAAMGVIGGGAGVLLAAAIGLAHATARAVALLRDVTQVRAQSQLASATAAGHLELLLKNIYWRRLDGALLMATAATAAVLAVSYF